MGFFKTLTGKMFAWNDGTPAVPRFDRAAMGDLDDYTGPNGVNSPAQAGFRAIDQDGNAIFDSMGLIAVMKNIGTSGTIPSSLGLAGHATNAILIPGSKVSIPTTRASQNFLILGTISADVAGIIGSEQIAIYLDGVYQGIPASAFIGSAPAGTVGQTACLTFVFPLGPITGLHVIDLRMVPPSTGATLNVYSGSLNAFLMGG